MNKIVVMHPYSFTLDWPLPRWAAHLYQMKVESPPGGDVGDIASGYCLLSQGKVIEIIIIDKFLN